MTNPILPPWAKPGCVVVKEYYKEITSGSAIGNSLWVVYIDAKGSEQETMKWVKWGGGYEYR